MIELPVDLRAALTTLVREKVYDHVYVVGENVICDTDHEGHVWLHPRVLAFKRAVEIVTKYAGV